MSKTKISHTAPWTYSQVLSGVIPLLLVIGLWAMWFTDNTPLEAAIVGSVLFGFMGVFFPVSNYRLKRNSTLYAEMENDEEGNISVWQYQPRPYWTGRLDIGRNKMPLSKTRSIGFSNVQGVQVVNFSFVGSKGYDANFTLPVRLLKQDAVRLYVAENLKKAGGKVKFSKEEDAKRFALLLAAAEDS